MPASAILELPVTATKIGKAWDSRCTRKRVQFEKSIGINRFIVSIVRNVNKYRMNTSLLELEETIKSNFAFKMCVENMFKVTVNHRPLISLSPYVHF